LLYVQSHVSVCVLTVLFVRGILYPVVPGSAAGGPVTVAEQDVDLETSVSRAQEPGKF